jgi:hypothetical protein
MYMLGLSEGLAVTSIFIDSTAAESGAVTSAARVRSIGILDRSFIWIGVTVLNTRNQISPST